MTDFTARRTMMVDTQVRPSDVTKFPIIDAMLKVAREDFVPVARREAAYLGENISLGEGRVLLEPRTLAKMLDDLGVENDELVLDIGCGYGYSSAVIAHMAEAVVAVEDDEQMAKEAQETLINADIDNVIVHHGPLAEGAQQHGPYDVVIVQGGWLTCPKRCWRSSRMAGGSLACSWTAPWARCVWATKANVASAGAKVSTPPHLSWTGLPARKNSSFKLSELLQMTADAVTPMECEI